ncbi:MAG: hypothetical protein HN337_09795 [Deltaproteobacteria bacterium]|nr:hypothetical protein [Deltaproteobacteria bacterium]
MDTRLYKRISMIGILALAAFFLPWIKACNQVETGYSLFFLEIFKRIDLGSINMLIAGLVFLLIPLYTIISAQMISKTPSPRFIKTAFSTISILAIWNLVSMGIPIFEDALSELSKYYYFAMALFIVFALCVTSLLSFLAYIHIWRKVGFKLVLADVILLFSLIPILFWGMSYDSKVGLWIYSTAICVRLIAAIVYAKKVSDTFS